jgi:hypothetical protein
MTMPVCDFGGLLATERKSFQEIQGTVKKVYGNKVLKRTQM